MSYQETRMVRLGEDILAWDKSMARFFYIPELDAQVLIDWKPYADCFFGFPARTINEHLSEDQCKSIWFQDSKRESVTYIYPEVVVKMPEERLEEITFGRPRNRFLSAVLIFHHIERIFGQI